MRFAPMSDHLFIFTVIMTLSPKQSMQSGVCMPSVCYSNISMNQCPTIISPTFHTVPTFRAHNNATVSMAMPCPCLQACGPSVGCNVKLP